VSIAAEQAWAAWVNAHPGLVGPGNPLAGGAYLGAQVRSPANGAYAVGSRLSQAVPAVVAEDGSVDVARITALIYGGTVGSAEAAATAYANAVLALTGAPVLMGDSGVKCLASDNLSGPMYVEQPSGGGEQFTFEVAADFVMAAQ
jgi:hypothetical protein